MAKITLWGFDGSTYVRTVKMLLAEKGVTEYEQVPLNVLEGEPRTAEHLERHPFGKVPVVDYDGFRIIETAAITRFLNDILPGRSLIPVDLRERARMDEVVATADSYGYGALVIGVAGYHLFPEFVGGKDEAKRREGLEVGRTFLSYAMRQRGGTGFIAGELSLADLYLAPMIAYVAQTPDAEALLGEPGIADWWTRMQGVRSFQESAAAG